MRIEGLHHVTAVCANAARTAEFYTQVLGMRLVKKTVNFDWPETYHLYLGDRTGSPGSLITFFEWPGVAEGRRGIGATDHIALRTAAADDLALWRDRLAALGLPVGVPFDEGPARALAFPDPDGLLLEIVAPRRDLGARSRADDGARANAGARADAGANGGGGPRIERIDHVVVRVSDIGRSRDFYTGTLGLSTLESGVTSEGIAAETWGVDTPGGGMPVVAAMVAPPGSAHARIGVGLTHHAAFETLDASSQHAWQAHLRSHDVEVTPVMDRKYFRSIYFRDPDGHILEIATRGPGMTVDEEEDRLGSRLALPDWLEPKRTAIESRLAPFRVGTP